MSSRVSVQRLCGHHEIDDFSCGELAFDVNLRAYWDGADSGDQTLVFAAVEGLSTVGYVAFQDILIHDVTRNTDHRLIHLASLAVDEEWHGSDVAAKLIRKVYAVKRLRSGGRRNVFRAAICASFHNPKVEEYLRTHGFEKSRNTIYWWRPFNS